MVKQSVSSYVVKRCPKCNQAWEKGPGGKDRHYGTDWPMISKLQNKVCLTCRNK